MRIKNNISAINSSRNLGISQGKLAKSMEKLSSGYRINRAGDDAAGLAISEGMRAKIRGLDQAMNNIKDGISMSNTGDGALTEVDAMLHRLETLALESANGTYDSTARLNIDQERAQLLEEIDRIGGSSDFNGIPLFREGTPPDKEADPDNWEPPSLSDLINLQIGATYEETMDLGRYYMSSEGLGLEKLDFTDQTKANEALSILSTAVQAVTIIRADFGAAQNHLDHTYNNLGVTKENMTAYESGIRDADVTKEYTAFTAESIVSQAAQSMLTQANASVQMVLNLLQ